jgi:hypothetical protein
MVVGSPRGLSTAPAIWRTDMDERPTDNGERQADQEVHGQAKVGYL